jgi:hypothetical protein
MGSLSGRFAKSRASALRHRARDGEKGYLKRNLKKHSFSRRLFGRPVETELRIF